jgi:hypothetical protein
VALGKDARAVAPLESHAEFLPGPSREPVGLLLGQAASRVPEAVPVRHGRMLVSAFTFYRGGAADGGGPGQHANAGAAGAVVRGRAPVQARRKIILAAAEAYRTAMRDFAAQPLLAVWYAHMDIEEAIGEFRSQVKAKKFKEAEKLLAKAHTRDSTQALGKLTTVTDGQRRIISTPPTIVPVEEVFADVQAEAIYQQVRAVVGKYRRSLQSDRRHLLEQLSLVQVARKVVGVGSVGTRLDRADGRRGRRRAAVPASQGSPAVGPG